MKTRIIHKLYNALTSQYSENGSGYPVLEPVLELENRFLRQITIHSLLRQKGSTKCKKKYKIQIHNKNIQETENYDIDSRENYSNIYRKTEISELSLDFK